jgi:hypothetical protein
MLLFRRFTVANTLKEPTRMQRESRLRHDIGELKSYYNMKYFILTAGLLFMTCATPAFALPHVYTRTIECTQRTASGQVACAALQWQGETGNPKITLGTLTTEGYSPSLVVASFDEHSGRVVPPLIGQSNGDTHVIWAEEATDSREIDIHYRTFDNANRLKGGGVILDSVTADRGDIDLYRTRRGLHVLIPHRKDGGSRRVTLHRLHGGKTSSELLRSLRRSAYEQVVITSDSVYVGYVSHAPFRKSKRPSGKSNVMYMTARGLESDIWTAPVDLDITYSEFHFLEMYQKAGTPYFVSVMERDGNRKSLIRGRLHRSASNPRPIFEAKATIFPAYNHVLDCLWLVYRESTFSVGARVVLFTGERTVTSSPFRSYIDPSVVMLNDQIHVVYADDDGAIHQIPLDDASSSAFPGRSRR